MGSQIPETKNAGDTLDLRYPIGKYVPPEHASHAERATWINELEVLPAKLRQAVAGLNGVQLDHPYRPGGWSVRQVVHHLADSHSNSVTRFRLALTEPSPKIKPYDEAAWAELEDAKYAPVDLSLGLLDALHARWVLLLRSLTEADFGKSFEHPELGKRRLDWALGLYAWHGRHHLAHIENVRSSHGW